jgi:hypothetical protein
VRKKRQVFEHVNHLHQQSKQISSFQEYILLFVTEVLSTTTWCWEIR